MPGTTVLVERDPSGDEDDRPLKMKLVKPKKRPAKKREPVGVGATASSDGEGSSPEGSGHDDADGDESSGDGGEPAPEAGEPTERPADSDE